MVNENLSTSWKNLLQELEFYDYFLQNISDKEVSDEYFESILSSLDVKDSKYKTMTLAYAFWLYKTFLDPISYQNVMKYFKLLDTVLIVYGPDPNVVEVINESRFLIGNTPAKTFTVPHSFDDITPTLNLPLLTNELDLIDDPSIRYFQKRMNFPVIIKGLVSHWPALTKWDKPSFWIDLAGHRFFPVEIGCHYLDKNWEQDIIQLNDFFQKYVFDTNNEEIAYIAQHNWIHQIPSLGLDFETPDICDIFLNPNMNNVMTHMWFGVKRTFTPLHYDKYNNILTQIVGQKYILLIDPKFSAIFSDGLDNTSKVIDEDISDYLLQHNIPFREAILKPGDSLFIPSMWWHQVKSLSFSISISFWF